jgi:hypothetical protein
MVMTEKSNHKFWRMPWSYPQCVAVVAVLVLGGLVAQMLVGPFDFGLLAFPVSLVVLILLLVLCVLLGFHSGSVRVRWVSGVPLSVSLLVGLALLALVMGVVPQTGEPCGVLGLDAVARSWAFVLVYVFVLLSLGTLLVRRLLQFRLCDWAFYANHVGVWLFLVAAGLGTSDEERYEMLVQEGETVWHAEDEKGYVRRLPLAIRLNDFDMDMYPPEKVIIERQTGEIQSSPALPLDTLRYTQVSMPAEPCAFLSDVDLYTEDGDTLKAVLEVNKPLHTGAWTVYQYGYDTQAGRLSSYSVFLLVHDPWSVGIYVGIVLMAIGSVSMMWKGRSRKKGGSHDVG